MIRKAIITSLVFLSFSSFAQKAEKSAVIFTVSAQPVTVGEFEYVYTKNNINNQADYSEKSLTDYLTLYENFRLKVKEAEEMKLDTISTLKTELEGYRKQLAKSYLTDKEITDQLIQEAYVRSKQEVNVSHILVLCDENAHRSHRLRFGRGRHFLFSLQQCLAWRESNRKVKCASRALAAFYPDISAH